MNILIAEDDLTSRSMLAASSAGKVSVRIPDAAGLTTRLTSARAAIAGPNRASNTSTKRLRHLGGIEMSRALIIAHQTDRAERCFTVDEITKRGTNVSMENCALCRRTSCSATAIITTFSKRC